MTKSKSLLTLFLVMEVRPDWVIFRLLKEYLPESQHSVDGISYSKGKNLVRVQAHLGFRDLHLLKVVEH